MAAELVETLRALQSNDNNLRSAAEKRFSDAKTNQPAPTVAALFQVLAEAQVDLPVREQAAVLLRQALGKLRDAGSTWEKLGAPAQAESKAMLLQRLEAEKDGKVRKKVADILQSLGNQLIDIEDGARPNNLPDWPELLPSLMKLVMDSSKEGGLRADALWTVKELLATIWPVMVANQTQTTEVLRSCLGDAHEGVQANAASMLCELVDNVEAKNERSCFAPLIPGICTALQRLADGSDTTLLNGVLQSMEGTANSIDFFKDAVASGLMPLLTTLAKSHKQDDTRRLALEVIASFIEGKPKAMSKVPGFIEQTVNICVQFLMELNDDVEEWAAEDDDEAEDEDMFTNGKEVIDRLSGAMAKAEKFPQVMEVLKPAIATLFQGTNWKQSVAGMALISQIAEYVDDDVTITQMIAAIHAQLGASHVRVRHAAWSALAQFSQDHDETMTSEELTNQLLPCFLKGLDDPNQRVLSRCMEAFQLYGQAVERELLEPFVPPMMEKLGQKLQCKEVAIQKKAVTYIAVLAGQMEDGFAPYYGALMPIFKQLISTMVHRTEERMLLGKTFECVSLLAKAVGPAGFRADAEVIMQAMIQAAQAPNLPSNDPVKEYMMQASQRICFTMKGDFLPFVPHILPGILEKFTLAPKELTTETRQGIDDDDEVNLTLMKGEDGKMKVMVMSTSEMEDLQNAIECVNTFVEELGKMYAPFVAQTAQALLPVFDFSMGEEIRDLAFETWGELCSAARDSGQGQVLTQLVHEFLNRILPALEATAPGPVDAEALKTRADGVTACLKKAGNGVLSADQVKHIGQVAMAAISASFVRREEEKKTQAKAGAEAADEEEPQGEDDDDELDLRVACCEIQGALMQGHPEEFMAQLLSQCMPLVQKLIQPSVAVEDRKLAVFVACDMLAHLGNRITGQWPHFMPQLMKDVMHENADIRQPACYGMSLAAKNPAFAEVAVDAAKTLAQVVSQSRSRAKKKSEKPAQAAADNAESALAEILMNHSAALGAGAPELWKVWVQGLPCQMDEEEGKKNHEILLQMVQQEKVEVVGQAGANLAQVLAIFVEVYKTDMANDTTSTGIGELVLKVPQANLEQLAGQMKEKQRKKLMRIHREALEKQQQPAGGQSAAFSPPPRT
mmetsp:Transcript_84291/g.217058  ORF Transcript_84291/g.217058 Transcript_84291/m.217058 type:complete len:1131 (-) Transcript_84291:51-3443(-)